MSQCAFCESEGVHNVIDKGDDVVCEECDKELVYICRGCGGFTIWTVTSYVGHDGYTRCQLCNMEYNEEDPSPWEEPEKHKQWHEE